MSEYKNINTFAVALMFLGVELGGLDEALEELWEKIPEATGGPKVSKDDFMAFGHELYRDTKIKVIEFIGEDLPFVDEEDLEPDDPEDIDEPLFGYRYKTRVLNSGEEMSHRDENDASKPMTLQDIFRPPGCGRNYGSQIMVIWSDGETMIVPEAGNRHYHSAWDDKRKWQPGCGDGTTPLCEAYARVGTHPEYMDIYHNLQPVNDDLVDPVETGWVRINWGGKDPDPDHDRRWWSKTSDSGPVPWVRQFELPFDFPMSGSANFRFSNGYEGRVPDLSARTKYLDHIAGIGRNVKYVKGQPNHPYVYDRKSDIAAPEGVKVTWMEYRIG